MALAIVGIAICATLSWFLVERPAQRYRRRLEAGDVRDPDAPPIADAPAGPTG